MAKDESDDLFRNFKSDDEREEKKKVKKVNIVETRTVDRGDQKREQIREVVLRYKPVLVERLVFLAIIAALLIYIFYSSFSGCAFSSLLEKDDVAPAAVMDTNESAAPPKVEEKPAEKPKTEEKPATASVPAGSVTFLVDKIDFDRDSNSTNPLKMKGVSYTIDNKKIDFTPTIKVYWYDADSEVAIKNKVRISFTFGIPVRAGQKISGTLKNFDSVYFDKTSVTEETVKVELLIPAMAKSWRQKPPQ